MPRLRPKPKLVALDGNGTLLGPDGTTISDTTVDVIARVQALGIPVVLVTGRPFEKAKPMLERTGMKEYVITENGTRAIRVSDGMALYETWLDGAEAAVPVQRIKECLPGQCFFAQVTKDGGLIEEAHPWMQDPCLAASASRFFGKTVPRLEEALTPGRLCAKSYATVPGVDDFPCVMKKIKASVGDSWEVREIKQLLPGISNTCEVQSTRVNKADGLRGLCEAIGISADDVWAFGDDSNDIRMLREMGWGVRMANHLPELAGVGDDVTQFTNQADGVARYLQEHLLDAS